jgi:TRAP-type C4-dicarboxylate transport system substrate-binding protein
MKRLLILSLILAIAVSLVLTGCTEPAETPTPTPTPSPTPTPTPSTPAAPEAVKLTFANWLPPPPISPVSVAFDAWAKDLEERTGGRYTVEVIHGGALAAIPEAYDVMATGVADISLMVPQDVEKPFPLTDAPSLPFFTSIRSDVAAKAWFDNVIKAGYLDEEYKDMKVVMTYAAIGDDFLTADPVYNVADLNGLKVTSGGGPTKVPFLKSVGAVGVFAGPPEVYEMLQKGIVEGAFCTGLGIAEFHWDEYVNYLIEPLRIGRVVHRVGMNLDTYNKMPDDVKAIVDSMDANGEYSLQIAKDFEDYYRGVMQEWLSTKGEIIEWSPEAMAELNETVVPIWENWIADKEAQGLPAREVVDAFYNGLKALGIEEPTVGYTPGG